MLSNFIFGWFLFLSLGIVFILCINGDIHFKKSQSKLSINLFCLLFIILGVFGNAITPDYPIYESSVRLIRATRYPQTHLEEFWVYFIRNFGETYFQYRIALFTCVFGILCIILHRVRKRINTDIFLSIFGLTLLYNSIGLRASLFLMMFTLGIVFLSSKKYIIAFIILFFSCFVHKVAYFAIPILILSIIPLNNGRIIIIYATSLIVFGLIIRGVIFSNISLIMDIMLDNGVPGGSYLEYDKSISEVGNKLWLLIDYVMTGCIFLLKLAILKLIFLSKKEFNPLDKLMFHILFWSTFIAISILSIGLPDRTIAYRCGTIGDLPMCYLWGLLPNINYCKYKKNRKYLLFIIIVMFLFQNIYIRGIFNRV